MWRRKREGAQHGNSLRVGSKSNVLSANQRVRFYSQLHLYLKNSHMLDTALTEMYGIYTDDGKKPRNKNALMVKEVLNSMASGLNFSKAIAPYVPEGEFFLLAAGEKSSYLKESMLQAVRLIRGKARIAASMRKAFSYNVFLSILMVAVLAVSAYFLIPMSMKAVKPEQLTGFAYAIYAMSQFVVNEGIYVLAVAIGMVILVRWAQPNYIGRYRVRLDRMWPFSLYRQVNGATFLISLSSLMQANVQANDALKELAEHAGPYIKQRILAARSGLHHGTGLGESLHMSGYQFPDREAIQHLRILKSQAGVETAIAEFADDWLEEAIKKTEAMADVAKNVGMVLIFVVAGVVVIGTAMIQRAAQSAMGIL